jgi:hypothetical protein
MAEIHKPVEAISSAPETPGQNHSIADFASSVWSANSQMWSDVVHGRADAYEYGNAGLETSVTAIGVGALLPIEFAGGAVAGALVIGGAALALPSEVANLWGQLNDEGKFEK